MVYLISGMGGGSNVVAADICYLLVFENVMGSNVSGSVFMQVLLGFAENSNGRRVIFFSKRSFSCGISLLSTPWPKWLRKLTHHSKYVSF